MSELLEALYQGQNQRVAELLADPLGHQDLIGGDRPSSRDLVPGHYLGVITLADTLDQGAPLS